MYQASLETLGIQYKMATLKSQSSEEVLSYDWTFHSTVYADSFCKIFLRL